MCVKNSDLNATKYTQKGKTVILITEEQLVKIQSLLKTDVNFEEATKRSLTGLPFDCVYAGSKSRSVEDMMSGQSEPRGSNAFSAAELEFLAEDEMIEVVPNLRMDRLSMICGDFGPFRPQIATQVPIWLAISLKKRGKCTIRPPDWMSVEKLSQVLEAERDSASSFEALPFHYVEISRLLFDDARDDIPDVYMVRSLIEDIKDVRFHKIGTGLEKLSSRTYAMKLNLSAMEVNVIRPFVTGGLETFYKLGNPDLIQESSDRPEYRRPDRGPRRELRR